MISFRGNAHKTNRNNYEVERERVAAGEEGRGGGGGDCKNYGIQKLFRLSPEILAKILKLLGKHKNSTEHSLKLSAVMRRNAYQRYPGRGKAKKQAIIGYIGNIRRRNTLALNRVV